VGGATASEKSGNTWKCTLNGRTDNCQCPGSNSSPTSSDGGSGCQAPNSDEIRALLQDYLKGEKITATLKDDTGPTVTAYKLTGKDPSSNSVQPIYYAFEAGTTASPGSAIGVCPATPAKASKMSEPSEILADAIARIVGSESEEAACKSCAAAAAAANNTANAAAVTFGGGTYNLPACNSSRTSDYHDIFPGVIQGNYGLILPVAAEGNCSSCPSGNCSSCTSGNCSSCTSGNCSSCASGNCNGSCTGGYSIATFAQGTSIANSNSPYNIGEATGECCSGKSLYVIGTTNETPYGSGQACWVGYMLDTILEAYGQPASQ